MKYLYILLFFNFLNLIFAQNNTGNSTEEEGIEFYDNDDEHCLRFTWLGPYYDRESNYNTTCGLLLDGARAKGVPCRHPLVVTYDGSAPDIQYMWKNHRNRVACRVADGQMCAKYVFKFNDKVQNATYMCVKVTEEGEGPVNTDSCFKQSKNGYDIEVCVCKPKKGPYLPCNISPTIAGSTVLSLSILSLIYLIL